MMMVKKPCGQKVKNGMIDAYSNHGWASVYLTFQSFWILETGAIFVLYVLKANVFKC